MSTRYRAEKLVQEWNNAWPGIQIKNTLENSAFPRMSNKTAGDDLVERICLFMKDELAIIRRERREEIDRLKARVMELMNEKTSRLDNKY